MGPLVYQTGKWQWTFWLLACINLGQFVLYIFLAPETAGFERPERAIDGTEARPLSTERTEKTPWWHLYFKFRRVSSDPWSQLPIEVVRPLAMVVKLPVILPTLAYSLVFAYCNVRPRRSRSSFPVSKLTPGMRAGPLDRRNPFSTGPQV